MSLRSFRFLFSRRFAARPALSAAPKRRFFLIAALACLGAVSTPRARAVLLLKESFDYAPGEAITGQSGGLGFGDWDSRLWNSGVESAASVADGGLSFGDLRVSGNALLSGASAENTDYSQSMRRFETIDAGNNETYWFSFLMRLDAVPAGASLAGHYGYVSLMSGGDDLHIGLLPQATLPLEQQSRLGFRSLDPNQPATTTSTFLDPASPAIYFMVIRIDFRHQEDGPGNTAEFNERITLYINPAPGTEAPNVMGEQSELYNIVNGFGSQLRYLGIVTGAAAGLENGLWTFDEFRIGTTYLDVAPIPEPSSMLLLGGGGLTLLAAGKRFLRHPWRRAKRAA